MAAMREFSYTQHVYVCFTNEVADPHNDPLGESLLQVFEALNLCQTRQDRYVTEGPAEAIRS